MSLFLLPPNQGVPLLMALSTANQLLSVRQLKNEMAPLSTWWPDGPGPYLLGGVLGLPCGLWLLDQRRITLTLLGVAGIGLLAKVLVA